MNKLIGHFGDKFSIYLLVFTIGSLLLYYVFGYIPHNQLLLDSYGIRVLENKALAISDKYKGYDNAVNSAPISYFGKWFFNSHPEQKYLFLKEDFVGTHYSTKPLGEYKGPITQNDFINKTRIDPNLIPVKRDPESKADIKRIWKDDRGSSYFIFTPSMSFFNGQSTATNGENGRKYPLLRTKISDFTANIKENDFFEDIFLVRAHKCQDCNNNRLQEEISGYGNYILDESKIGLVKFNLNDSSENASSGIYQETVLGKQYKVYYKMIKLRRGLDVYAVGLIPLDVFNAEAKKVSVWFLVFCSLGALLLIFLFPVLKLFLLSQGERLSTNDISLGVFSVLLCTCLCFILSVGFYFFWGLEMERNDQNIMTLAKEISEKTRQELCTLRVALTNEAIFSKQKIDTTKFDSLIGDYDFNEVFLLKSTGFMESIYMKTKKHQDIKKIKPPDLVLFPVSVAERNYFKAIHENGRLDYFLQSINSFSSGNSEVAISMPTKCNGQDGYVGVVTTPLQSLLRAGVPSPYKFVLLDDNGDVKFHSGWNQIKSENFLKEVENYKEVNAYLKNAITDYINFTYMRRECRGYILPIEKNWSLLVYYEKGDIYHLSAQIFILCLISLFIVVFFCMFIHWVLALDRYSPVLLKTTPFMYAWLNPNNFSSNIWMYLFMGNLVLLTMEALALWTLQTFVSSLTFALLTITASYSINYFVLRTTKSVKPLVYFAIMISFLTIFFLMIAGEHWWLCLIVMVAIAIGIMARWQIPPKVNGIPTVSERQNTFLTYRFFIISWLLIIMIGPSVSFLVMHYNHEKLLARYACLIADVQKLREKTNGSDSEMKDPLYYSVLDRAVQIVNTDKASVCDSTDLLYYNQLPQFAFLNSDNTSLDFNYVPQISGLMISRYGNILEVASKTNRLGMSLGFNIQRQSQVEGAGLDLNPSAFLAAVLILGLAILLWWVLTTLTRKIFYLPKHGAWDELQPSPSESTWGNVNFEFPNGEKDLHVLNGVESKIQKQPDLKDNSSTANWEHEKLIVDLQKEQNNLYTLNWDNCTEDEKFFLYDLAEDGVVNRPADEMLKNLSQKKLIRLYPRLEIVNVSFANFILTRLKKGEIQKMERQESRDGRWKHARVLLIIIIIAALAFLSIAEENFFGRATAIIGSITLVLPNLMTLFGSITKLFTKGAAASQ